jgi:ADP-ribose pyrophosphatase
MQDFLKNSLVCYRGRRFDVRCMELPNRDGKLQKCEAIAHPGSVVILPLLSAEEVVMIRNERFATGKILWELPAGTREPNELPLETAKRELIEETGYKAQEMQLLTSFYTSPGISNEMMHGYLGRGLTLLQQQLDPGETIDVEILSWSKIFALIDNGEICDGKTLMMLLFYMSALQRGKKF